MNKEEKEKLIKTLSKNFKNREIYVIFTGAIDYTITMNNIKFFITKDLIILVNEDDRELHIDPFYIEHIQYTKATIDLKMCEGYNIRIDSWRSDDFENFRKRP